MSYEELPYTAAVVAIPAAEQSFIDAADRQYELFCADQLQKRYPKYVPSEPSQVYAALKYVTDKGLLVSNTFVEWGCGFGVATGLAKFLGYQATGIEIEPELVQIAYDLFLQENIEAQLICSSYIPDGIIEYENFGTSDIVSDNFNRSINARRSYPEMHIQIDEISLFFVYPWPGEQEMMLKLFDVLAGEGALLIAYFGDQDTHIYRKIDDPQLA